MFWPNQVILRSKDLDVNGPLYRRVYTYIFKYANQHWDPCMVLKGVSIYTAVEVYVSISV
jgi:hypothetical protein